MADRGKLVVTPEAAAMLGASVEEVENMTLRDLAERCFDLGLEVVTSGWDSPRGGLTVTGSKWEWDGERDAG